MRLQFRSSSRFLDAAAAVAMIIASGVVVWVNLSHRRLAVALDSSPPIPASLVSLSGSPQVGSTAARVVVIEYSDFQCPYCGAFARESWPALRRDYVDSGRVLFAFRNFPLSIHRDALKAAEAAECARRQGRFWQMHDELFQDPKDLGEAHLIEHATRAGLALPVYRSCMSSETARNAVQADTKSGDELKLNGTPTFFFGTQERDGFVRVTSVQAGALPLERFKQLLDGLLKAGRS
jgi:protein-disulfide isomerase